MNLLKNSKKFCYVTSIVFHLMLFLTAVVYVDFSNKTPLLGDKKTQLVNSYIYKNDFIQDGTLQKAKNKNKSTKITSQPIKKNFAASADKALIKVARANKQAYQTAEKMYPAVPQSAAASSSNGVQTEELLALLHTAIQKQQHYPLNAMQMERQGRATVKFTLFANGTVSHLHIIKSSGTESLDRAALAAVQNAAPFEGVNQYIHSAEEYTIDVVFELT